MSLRARIAAVTKNHGDAEYDQSTLDAELGSILFDAVSAGDMESYNTLAPTFFSHIQACYSNDETRARAHKLRQPVQDAICCAIEEQYQHRPLLEDLLERSFGLYSGLCRRIKRSALQHAACANDTATVKLILSNGFTPYEVVGMAHALSNSSFHNPDVFNLVAECLQRPNYDKGAQQDLYSRMCILEAMLAACFYLNDSMQADFMDLYLSVAKDCYSLSADGHRTAVEKLVKLPRPEVMGFFIGQVAQFMRCKDRESRQNLMDRFRGSGVQEPRIGLIKHFADRFNIWLAEDFASIEDAERVFNGFARD
ncbi:hypothetical protein BJX99DRAFT_254031 [Aspergillus californicus]